MRCSECDEPDHLKACKHAPDQSRVPVRKQPAGHQTTHTIAYENDAGVRRRVGIRNVLRQFNDAAENACAVREAEAGIDHEAVEVKPRLIALPGQTKLELLHVGGGLVDAMDDEHRGVRRPREVLGLIRADGRKGARGWVGPTIGCGATAQRFEQQRVCSRVDLGGPVVRRQNRHGAARVSGNRIATVLSRCDRP